MVNIMFDFFIKKSALKNTQRFIDGLNPKVQVLLHQDLPLPSISLLKKMCVTVSKINGLEESMSKLSDGELKAKAQIFKQQYRQAIQGKRQALEKLEKDFQGNTDKEEKEDLNLQIDKAHEDYRKEKKKILEEILPEAFAVVRETGKRVLRMRHFDVQLIGGMVLHQGSIAEMTTGEGKTLVATLAAYLNALTGEGVHVVTVNDYLAKRDREWMGPLYEFLGLTVGVIQHDIDPRSRQQAYNCDITYGTNNEFGFDYLRDNMVNFKEEMVQRGHHFAIVDEVDSILIDEARTPLIISGPAEESTDKYYRAFQITQQLKGRRITEKDEIDAKHQEINLGEGFEYLADEKAKSISLTEIGEEKAAQLFGVANIHDMDTIEYRHHVLQALKAKEFFALDVDYVLRDGQVIIVDEFTGRLMPGRRWSDGLHQAVEAKEGIKIERENQTLATITFQNYFRLYEKLSGMTGTAYTEAMEFKEIYDLDVIVIPTNKKLQRVNHSDCVYKTLKEKFDAVVKEIDDCHQRGQPVLVGTISIEKSEMLSRLLKQKGIAHQVLNAKFHEMEAHIIAQAGRYQAVTIATNMAGRGTDIVLGGNAEHLAQSLLAQKLQGDEGDQQKQELLKKFVEQFRDKVKEEHDQVVSVGGLHVLGTERHESRRIDNQLRGRQGRQGDPGSSRFFISLQDDLMRLFASDRIMSIMDRLGMEEGQVLEHPWLTNAIENAQKKVETHNFEIRKHLLEYDNVMNKQREVIYSLRRFILDSQDIKNLIFDSLTITIDRAIATYSSIHGDGFDSEGLDLYLKSKLNFALNESKETLQQKTAEEIRTTILEGLKAQYQAKEQEISSESIRQMERMLFLHTIDLKWKDHLYTMDQVKEGIGLRSYGQRDPLIEYKKEAFAMFQRMYDMMDEEIVEMVFKLQPAQRSMRLKGVFSSIPQHTIHNEASGLSQAVAQMAEQRQMGSPPPMPAASLEAANVASSHKSGPKVGRNDPCPCGSGKKYKKCCGR
jgi:preprotein translocase subunit SecA